MPVKTVSIRELQSLSTVGGRGRRKHDDCIPWELGGNLNRFVTPQVDETTAESSLLSSTEASSEEEYDSTDKHPTLHGNRILDIVSLTCALEKLAGCRECMHDDLEDFVNYCRQHGYELNSLLDNWKSKRLQHSYGLTVDECTDGLGTQLTLRCHRCSRFGQHDRRGWKDHSVIVHRRKNNMMLQTKSELCHYDINIRFCLAMQLLGLGGEHAAVLSAFLDLPNPEKWRRQFGVIEKALHPTMDDIKRNCQEEAAEKEVALTLDSEDHPIEQSLIQEDVPIYRVRASFDMGWQVRSSGGKYGSSTGHAFLIGALSKKIMDSELLNKKCSVCTKHECRTGSIDGVKDHHCMKNYEGTSKSMEAAALVTMLIRMLDDKSVSISAIISDDDSCGRARARHINNGGQLPPHVEEPTFLADPSHRKRVFARAIYNLANAPVKTSKVTKGLAGHLKNCYGACVKRNRHHTPEELSRRVTNILEHICGNHECCDESWCYDKKAAMLGKEVNQPKDHRIDKKDEKTYLQLKEVFDQYANITMMAQCNHPYDTQTNEALNNAVANVAPKTVYYSGTISLSSRICLIIGIHNMGHVPFMTSLFDRIGVQMTPILKKYLLQKSGRKEYKQKYIRQPDVKVRRSKKQRKTWQEVYKERTDTSYGPGIALAAVPPNKRRKVAQPGKPKTKTCKCGSTTHARTTHRDCPLRKTKVGSVTVHPTAMTPLEQGALSATIAMRRPDAEEGHRSDRTHDGDETKEVGRRSYVATLTSSLCLCRVATQIDNDSATSDDEVSLEEYL